MKTKCRKICALTLAAMLAVTAMSGCGKKEKETSGIVDGAAKYGTTYPLNAEGETLSMWIINSVHNEYKSYQDMPFFQEVQKRTGVKLDIQGPTGGQFEESFNLMIASGELPDIIMYDWGDKKVAGGPAKYIGEGYIIQLNDVIDNYAPNLKKVLNENPEIDKMVKTDEGQYYVFPNINLQKPAVWAGPTVRKDWLDELGLEVPTTIDDWHTMLTEFKNKKGSTSPLWYLDWMMESSGFLSGAYGTQQGYYLNENKEIEYGPATEKWKNYLALLNQWYAEGLIDKDIATLDIDSAKTKTISGKNGAYLGSAGDLGPFMTMAQKTDPKAKFIGVPYPTLNKGEVPEFGICDLKFSGCMSSAITTDCENVELAAKFLDYFYSDEGRLLANFGIEGESYNMVDGYPKLSDMVVNSGDIQNEISKYANSQFSVIDPRYYEQRLAHPEQKDAVKVWAQTNAEAHRLPLLLQTAEEADEITKYMTEIETYVEEMLIRFMTGSESLDNFDSYIARLKDMKIDRVIELYNDAYKRYGER